ncbi:MAG: very short patch repair endonuclease [Verrucomicrobiales bacterium]|nr:very short patch repair endonuclease [Verrucomicrobiales bacterium]
MSRVRARDTGPELKVRRALRKLGLHYRLQAKDLPGKPDIVFRKQRLAVFVHGCFWHQHKGCVAATIPKTRIEFWRAKLRENVLRDSRNATSLRKAGWAVAVIWGCQTSTEKQLMSFASRVATRISRLSQTESESNE